MIRILFNSSGSRANKTGLKIWRVNLTRGWVFSYSRNTCLVRVHLGMFSEQPQLQGCQREGHLRRGESLSIPVTVHKLHKSDDQEEDQSQQDTHGDLAVFSQRNEMENWTFRNFSSSHERWNSEYLYAFEFQITYLSLSYSECFSKKYLFNN